MSLADRRGGSIHDSKSGVFPRMRSWKTRRSGAAATSRLAQDTRTPMHTCKYQVLGTELPQSLRVCTTHVGMEAALLCNCS
jgi:hypothetical protein